MGRRTLRMVCHQLGVQYVHEFKGLGVGGLEAAGGVHQDGEEGRQGRDDDLRAITRAEPDNQQRDDGKIRKGYSG